MQGVADWAAMNRQLEHERFNQIMSMLMSASQTAAQQGMANKELASRERLAQSNQDFENSWKERDFAVREPYYEALKEDAAARTSARMNPQEKVTPVRADVSLFERKLKQIDDDESAGKITGAVATERRNALYGVRPVKPTVVRQTTKAESRPSVSGGLTPKMLAAYRKKYPGKSDAEIVAAFLGQYGK